MMLNTRRTHSNSNSTRINRQRYEHQDDYEFPSEDVLDLNMMRNIQNIRALAAEAEYIGSKVRFRALELEFQQLRSHILGKLNDIQIHRDHQRQELKSDYQNASTLRRWQSVEKKMNQGVDDCHYQIIESRQVLRQSEAAMQQAMMDSLLAGRRLLKFDEILKVFNEYS